MHVLYLFGSIFLDFENFSKKILRDLSGRFMSQISEDFIFRRLGYGTKGHCQPNEQIARANRI